MKFFSSAKCLQCGNRIGIGSAFGKRFCGKAHEHAYHEQMQSMMVQRLEQSAVRIQRYVENGYPLTTIPEKEELYSRALVCR